MFDLKTINGCDSHIVPTELTEITKENLNKILKNVEVAKHHCVIALCGSTTIPSVILGGEKIAISIVPIIAKAHHEDDINDNVGDIACLSRTAIEHGLHIIVDHTWSNKSVSDAIRKKPESMLIDPNEDNPYKIAMNSKQQIYMIEFKIVPVGTIQAIQKVSYETITV